jgi:hypothetical protein
LARIGGKSRPGSVAAAPEARASGAPASPHYINHAVKQLPWRRLSAIGFEDLNGLKRGKSQSRGKNFRIAAAPWTYRRVRHGSNLWHGKTVFGPLLSIREAEHVPLVVRTIGAKRDGRIEVFRADAGQPNARVREARSRALLQGRCVQASSRPASTADEMLQSILIGCDWNI